MSLIFSLHRACRPALHLDRTANLKIEGNENVLSYLPDQKLVGGQVAVHPSQQLDAAGVTARLELVPANSTLFLGETCVFYLTLANQGSSTVTTLHIKVECSVEGGSSSVLHDDSSTPLQQLPPLARHDVVVQTDVKEQGQMSLVASAVFTDNMGERRYHVQFFKLQAASPLSVKTRVRCLPHIQQQPGSINSSSSSWGSRTTRCFLEVGVENGMQVPLLLHAVNLLTAAGIDAKQLALCEPNPPQQQQQQQQQHGQQQVSIPLKKQHLMQQQQQDLPNGLTDTELQHDVDDSSTARLAEDTSDVSGQRQHELAQLLTADSGSPVVVVPQACSHNYLWQIDHHLSLASNASSVGGTATAAAARTSSSGSTGGSSSNAVLGRLELHWSSFDGKFGKLLTQPLSGPVSAFSGKEVLLQLSQLLPVQQDQQQQQQQQQQQLQGHLVLWEPVTATFTLTAAGEGRHGGVGPLLVLYTDQSPGGPSPGSNGGESSSCGLPSSGSAAGGTSCIASNGIGSRSASAQQRPLARGSSSAGSSCSSTGGIVVQGLRSRRLQPLAAGESVTVSFQLLPVCRGWVRLPTFVVVSEADGRLLDSVHDVAVLVS